jgi:NAD(P)-dependent dehydrogenase (short-subunit alcohol dehydrogenase family)
MILEKFSMNRKSALVTGSSRGRGCRGAIRLAEAGTNLAIDLSGDVPKVTQQKLRAVGADRFAVAGDVSDASVCLQLWNRGYTILEPSMFWSTMPESFGAPRH